MSDEGRLTRIGRDVGDVVLVWVVIVLLVEAAAFVLFAISAEMYVLGAAVVLAVAICTVLLFRLRRVTVVGAIVATVAVAVGAGYLALFWFLMGLEGDVDASASLASGPNPLVRA